MKRPPASVEARHLKAEVEARHVASTVEGRHVTPAVESRHLESPIVDGAGAATDITLTPNRVTPAELRRAVILKEILDPPLALREP